jgi:hypothetical protein
LSAHPTRSFMWKLWVSWPLNSRGWRSSARGLSGLPRGFATCPLGHHPVGFDWPIVWMRPPDSLGQSWLHGERRTMSRRPCGLWLRELGTSSWTMLMIHLLWQHHRPWRRRYSRARSTPQPLTGSAGAPGLRWLPPCHIFGAEIQARAARVWAQCRPNRESGGRPLDQSARNLRLVGVTHSSLGYPQPY